MINYGRIKESGIVISWILDLRDFRASFKLIFTLIFTFGVERSFIKIVCKNWLKHRLSYQIVLS